MGGMVDFGRKSTEIFLLALCFCAGGATAGNELNGLVQYADAAIPPGRRVAITLSEEWLPEPFQSKYYQAPPQGQPVSGCLSVVRVDLEPAGGSLERPLTLTFSCSDPDEQARPFGFIKGRWTPVPFRHDGVGRITITVWDLTTYALLNEKPLLAV